MRLLNQVIGGPQPREPFSNDNRSRALAWCFDCPSLVCRDCPIASFSCSQLLNSKKRHDLSRYLEIPKIKIRIDSSHTNSSTAPPSSATTARSRPSPARDHQISKKRQTRDKTALGFRVSRLLSTAEGRDRADCGQQEDSIQPLPRVSQEQSRDGFRVFRLLSNQVERSSSRGQLRKCSIASGV